MAYCANCGTKINGNPRFCPGCGKPIAAGSNNTGNGSSAQGHEVHTCPNCGDIINSFTAACPSCGYEVRNEKSASSVKQFTNELLNTYSDERKVLVIRNFPIPNSKEDILEFMLLASSNLQGTQKRELFEAWIVKFEQSYQKAKIVLKNDSDLKMIQELFDSTNEKIKKEKRKFGLAIGEANIVASATNANSFIELIGKNLLVIAGLVMFILAITTYNGGGNGSLYELVGMILLIVSAASMLKKTSPYLEFLVVAAAGGLSMFMSRFLYNGSILQLTGGVVLIITAVKLVKKNSVKGK